jgi:succinyl-diaminopimelate desuccinylase
MMVFEIAKKLEPSHEQGLHVRSIEGGNAPNMVPDRCRAILIEEKQKYEPVREAVEAFRARTGHKVYFKGRGKSVEVSAEGVAAHGAHPEDGLNAISILMELLSELPIANEGAAAFIDFYREHIDYETNGHRLGIEACDEESGGLIVNVGQIALGREAAILTVNVRNPVTRKEDDVYDDLRPVIDRYGLGVVRVTGVAPLYYADGDPLVETLMDVYRAGTGDAEAQPLVIGGGTYARAIPHAVAFGPRFPGKPDVMHQKDEYIEEEDLLRACRIYADAIERLAGKDFRL